MSNEIVNIQERLRAIVARGRQQMAKLPEASNISFNNGEIKVGDRIIGAAMRVIALHPQFVRSYYADLYDPDNVVPPNCYSYDNAGPHAEAEDKQSDSCITCKWNEWGSDSRGKGKACREGLRVAFLPAGGNITPETVAGLPILTAKFSVLNSKDINATLDALYSQYTVPFGALCDLTVRRDPKRQVVNTLDIVEPINEPAVLEALAARVEDAEKKLTSPYPKSEQEKPKSGKGTRKF